MALFKKETKEEKELREFRQYVSDFRSKIPDIYNQCMLLDDLPNGDINHFVSISNRTDGKSTNYIHFFIRFSIDYGVGFSLAFRNWTLRDGMTSLLIDIFDMFDDLDSRDLYFKRLQTYIIVFYQDTEIGILFDLNNASDLKFYSNHLKKFPIIVYDEFLALESDYIHEEYEKLATVYESIDRHQTFPIIKHPIVFYLGNAVNFSSPIIANLKLFNILETHEMNTKKIYNDIILENHFNIKVNEKRNASAFRRENHAMSTGQFSYNKHMIIDENTKLAIKKHLDFFYIKLENEFLLVQFSSIKRNLVNLSILSDIPSEHKYFFNMQLKDNTPDSTFLTEFYYDETHDLKYNKRYFFFENAYTKDRITGYSNYSNIYIQKCISFYLSKTKESEEKDEQVFLQNQLEKQKIAIAKKFLFS